jgi:hypothetical protein
MKRLMNCIVMACCVFLLQPCFAGNVEEEFSNPPKEAKPWAYWCWVNGVYSYSQITKELEEIKAKGMAGFNIFELGNRGEKGSVPDGPAFMGPESVDGMAYAIREAKRLGLELGLIVSSSWDAGGSWIPPKYGTMGLFEKSITIEGPTKVNQELPFPDLKSHQIQNNYLDLIGQDGKPVFYKEIATIAIPADKNDSPLSLDEIIDLSDKLNNDNLVWDAPKGKWIVTRYICTNTGETLKVHSPNSIGLSLDHFNPDATRFHFQHIIDQLTPRLGPLSETALKYMYLCSYEVRGKIWTPNMLNEFKQRRGYDLTPYMPVLFDRIVVDQDTTDRILFDYKKTLSDMIIENHYMQARDMVHEQGLLICSEAGGPGAPVHNCPVEALRALGALDIPRGEFWNKHQRLDENGIDILQLIKEIACASHIYGKTIVQGEAFTSFRHWQEGAYELKPLGDKAMCEGLNHFMFHTFAHVPPEAGIPGWMYHAGTHINTTRVWWPMAQGFINYLSRCCYLLREGLFVGDVCFYYGDQAPNFVKPKHVKPTLGYGYDYDYTNSDVILNRMSVKDGRIALPDGMSYAVLSLPEQDAMDPTVLAKIESLVKQGATVVGPKPTRSHGFLNAKQNDQKIQQMAAQLWGNCDGKSIKENSYGKGKIVWGKTVRDVLLSMNIPPDIKVANKEIEDSIDFIHRKIDNCEAYFVVNKTEEWLNAECSFRVTGKQPELWDPDTDTKTKQYHFKTDNIYTTVPITLAPLGSIFVMFKDSIDSNRQYVESIDSNGSPITVEVKQNNNSYEFIAPKSGRYSIRTNDRTETIISAKATPNTISLNEDWEVRFPHGWGVPTRLDFPKLISWTDHELEDLKYFSGIGAYHKTINIPSNYIADDIQLLLDLGHVKEMAHIYMNGYDLGIVWKVPFQVDITPYAVEGENRLVVEVANTWNNRLVGDSHLPKEERRTNSNIHKGPTVWEKPWKEVPLIESGLIGPVEIKANRRVILSDL